MVYNKKVVILMSTYNGELYLKEQLDSIFAQDYEDIELLVRDDGSSDSTIAILKEYSKKYPNMQYYSGKNLKPAHSFLNLLCKAPIADYYAFADQDDVWLEDKISSAVSLLEEKHADFYHSNFFMVDSKLTLLETSKKRNVLTIGHAAVLFTTTGCTMMISSRLREVVIGFSPKNIIMHDSWLFKIALAFCMPVVFDDSAHILYRQHGSNVLGGIGMSFLDKWGARIQDFFNPKCMRSNELRELLKGYFSSIDVKTKSIIETLASYKHDSFGKRLLIAFNPAYKTGVFSKDLLFKISILLKTY